MRTKWTVQEPVIEKLKIFYAYIRGDTVFVLIWQLNSHCVNTRVAGTLIFIWSILHGALIYLNIWLIPTWNGPMTNADMKRELSSESNHSIEMSSPHCKLYRTTKNDDRNIDAKTRNQAIITNHQGSSLSWFGDCFSAESDSLFRYGDDFSNRIMIMARGGIVISAHIKPMYNVPRDNLNGPRESDFVCSTPPPSPAVS